MPQAGGGDGKHQAGDGNSNKPAGLPFGFTRGSRGAFALDVLKGLGAPLSRANVLFMLGWMGGENTTARFNPFATTQPMSGAGAFNSVGVRNYTSWGQGVQATIITMTNGRYGAIVSGLKSGSPSFTASVGAQLRTWGTGVFGLPSGFTSAGIAIGQQGSVGNVSSSGSNASRSGGSLDNSGSPAEIKGILQGLGLAPNAFLGLIDAAVRNGWTQDELLGHLYASQQFHDMFPGIFRKDGSLIMSPLQYRQQADLIKKTAADYDVMVDKNRIGLLIHHEKSADEVTHIFQAFKAAKNSEADRVTFNAILKVAGQKELDKGEWFKFFATKPTGLVADLHEAFSLQQAGLQGTSKDFLAAAKQIGHPGDWQYNGLDISGIVQEVRKQKDFVGPELHQLGITDSDLAVMASGVDPKGQVLQLQQVLRNRQALSQAGAAPAQQTAFAGTERYG